MLTNNARQTDLAANPRSCRVTIGMPVHNGAKYIAQALESLLAQSFVDFGLMISDNASEDATPEVCQGYAARDPRIRYIRHPENQGAFWNFNFLLQNSHSYYFMWAASDDMWEPQFISECVSLLEANPPAVLACCRWNNIDQGGKWLRSYAADWRCVSSSSKLYRLLRMILRRQSSCRANFIYGLFRREALRSVGGVVDYGKGSVGLDMLTLLRLLCVGPFAFSDRCLFHKREQRRTVPGVFGHGVLVKKCVKHLEVTVGGFRFVRSHMYGVGRVIRESELPWWHKKILQAVSTYAEVRWHIENVLFFLIAPLKYGIAMVASGLRRYRQGAV